MLKVQRTISRSAIAAQRRAGQSGMALLEALIGLLVFSVGILAVIGLQASSIRNTTEARSRIEAQGFSNQILGQMWVDRGNLASYAGSSVIAELPGGVRDITVNGNQVTVTVSWQQAGATRRYTTTTWIEGGS